MTSPQSSGRLIALAFALGVLDFLSCFAAPETCRQCNQEGPDMDGGPGGSVVAGTGGASPGSGGNVGTAGTSGSGGLPASAGSSGSAGKPSTGTGGGAAIGGSGAGAASGGASAGGKGGAAAGGGTTGTGGSGGTSGTNGSGGAAGGRGGSASGGAVGGAASSTGGSAGGAPGVGGASGAGGRGGAGGTAIDPDLVLWYKFDEASGTSATDAAMFGGTARNGTLTNVSTGAASFSATAKVGAHSVSLTGTSSTVGGYVSLPSLSTVAPGAITIACWVYMTADRTWQRVFDFGKAPANGAAPSSYMFLTTHQAGSPGSVRFAISTSGNGNEQQINMSTPAVPSLNAWHHMAVTLGAGTTYTGTLYLDRAVAGTNTAMTLHWSDLGTTDKNAFGQSAYAADPYFAGMLDDCRVYRRALSASEITALP